MAAQIPGAKFIEYPGSDHVYFSGDVEECLVTSRSLSLDIVRFHRSTLTASSPRFCLQISSISTRSAAEMGDQTWRRLLDSHDELAREMVEKHRGTLIKTTGDGILATFDGPGRAVRCALAFRAAAKQIGLPLRAGVHTGEIEIRGRDIGGIAVHAAARVMAQSQYSEVLVSRVVTDIVAAQA